MTIRYIYITLGMTFFSIIGKTQSEKPAILAQPFFIQTEIPKDSTQPANGLNWGSFMVLNVTANTSPNPGYRGYQLQLVAYDTGIFPLPYPALSNGIATENIRVLAPSAEDIKDYSPLKEMEEAPQKIALWRWIVFFAGLIVLAIILIYLYRKRITSQPAKPVTAENVFQKIQTLKTDWAKQTISSIALGDGLVNILRSNYRVNTKRSTRQLLQIMEKEGSFMPLPKLKEVLENCDAWRFGKRKASLMQGNEAINQVEKFMEKITPKAKII